MLVSVESFVDAAGRSLSTNRFLLFQRPHVETAHCTVATDVNKRTTGLVDAKQVLQQSVVVRIQPSRTHSASSNISRPRVFYKAEINLALADLRYTGNIDAVGDDIVTVSSADDYLEGNASSTVRLAWPTGSATRPPTLSFRSPMVEMHEDETILLGPVHVRFGDGRSVVQGKVRCSAGAFALGEGADGGIGGVNVVDGHGAGDTVVLRGLPVDVATALSTVTYTPPTDWNSRANGVVTLTMAVQPTESDQVRLLLARLASSRRENQSVSCHRYAVFNIFY